MRNKSIIKPSDNTKQLALETKHRNRLNSIKHELETGKMNSFEQMFKILSETSISNELGISYYPSDQGLRTRPNSRSET